MESLSQNEARDRLNGEFSPDETWNVPAVDASGLSVAELPKLPYVRRLNLANCAHLKKLPDGLRCYEVDLSNTKLTALPDDIDVEFRIDLSNNEDFSKLPVNLKTGTLVLRGCVSLVELPEGLDVAWLNLNGCVSFRRWPEQIRIAGGELDLGGCIQLTYLPATIGPLARLDLRGCQNIHYLPDDLVVHSSIDLADTGITYLPEGCKNAQIRWRGVPITEQIAFHPETMQIEQIFNEPNAEVRRVMIERFGYDRLLEQAEAETLDQDSDPGGDRKLVRVDLQEDEPLVCLMVRCPSTGRQYSLRVPPAVRSCHQAAAWLAGFDNPDDYQPVLET